MPITILYCYYIFAKVKIPISLYIYSISLFACIYFGGNALIPLSRETNLMKRMTGDFSMMLGRMVNSVMGPVD